jgi:hypothetical protein
MANASTLTQGGVWLLNRAGRHLPLPRTLTGLDSAELMAAAKRRTGASDFGPWQISSALDRLIASYQQAPLTTLGQITVRETLVSSLSNLIAMARERDRLPDIVRQTITQPVFVIGLPRTGTTLLHGLLAQDSNNRAPLSWEVMYPASYRDDPAAAELARAKAAKRLAWANRLAPAFKRIHPIDADLPQECIAITAHVMRSIQFHTTHDVPAYQDWLEADSHADAYQFHRDFVQHLEYGGPGRRWVFKAPGHLFALPALLAAYPDAKVIQTHRDPLNVIASLASHTTVLRRAFSDRVDPHGVGQDWADRWTRALYRFLESRDQQPTEQFLDVDYDAIEQRPLATVANIYDWLNWPLSTDARQAMQAFLDANPKNKHGAHRYDLATYGLQADTQRKRFEPYCSRFGIPL